MKEKEFYQILVHRYIAKQLNDEELGIFIQLVVDGKLDNELILAMNTEANIHIADENQAHGFIKTKRWLISVSSAAAIILIGFGFWFYKYNWIAKDENPKHVKTNDISPGKHVATLILANGKSISLSDKKLGVIITKDQLTYNDGTQVTPKLNAVINELPADGEISIQTPRGGTYKVRLPDGTDVWLNAASKLVYSLALNNSGKRKVKLEGEAYFEVAKDKKHPFIVYCTAQEVEVLGTYFNVNSYTDEKTARTTVVEGSVKVNGIVLKPNQQSVLAHNNFDIITIDADETIAWKNGKFRFTNADLEEVLRQLGRWYDVDIKYVGEIPIRKFTGGIDRNINASEALAILKYLKVNFRIEGKSIIVSK